MDKRCDTEFNGKWRFLKHSPLMPKPYLEELMGTLFYYKDKPSILKLYHAPALGLISSMPCNYDVVWGSDANGYELTLFNLRMIEQPDMSTTIFSVEYCLVGRHIETIDTPVFDRCIVRFPYLKNWAFKCVRCIQNTDEGITTILSKEIKSSILEWTIEDKIKLQLHRDYNYHYTRYETTIKEDTFLYICGDEPISIRKFLQLAHIFKQFLSIALYGEQHPCSIEFRVSTEVDRKSTKLLYRLRESRQPFIIPLIKFELLESKLSDILRKWYSDYEQMAPICDYLIQSIHRDSFDTPNFLIIAQALDGYHKRFVNKRNGKDVRKYEQQMNALLKLFNNVGVLQKCKIDTEVLAHSRHKYSHLMPDEDTKNTERAVSGSALFRLTLKAMALLTCCILDNLKLTTDEINKCLEDSELSRIIDTISFYED